MSESHGSKFGGLNDPWPENREYVNALEDAVAHLVRDWPRRNLTAAVNELRELVERETGRNLEAEASTAEREGE